MTLTKKDLPRLKELNSKIRTFIDEIFDWVSPLGRNSLLSEMYDFKGQLEKTIDDLENDYWTYEDKDGEVFDGEFESRQAAHEYAEQKLADRCCDDGDMRNGETREEEIVLIHFKYDDEGEMIKLEREDDTIEYEHYHGDLAEHGVWHSGGGGVL